MLHTAKGDRDAYVLFVELLPTHPVTARIAAVPQDEYSAPISSYLS